MTKEYKKRLLKVADNLNNDNKVYSDLLKQKSLEIEKEIGELEFGKDEICMACIKRVKKIIKKHLR